MADASEGAYTARELMVAAAAREIRDGERVFVGMRLPLLAFQVAVRTHAPNALAVFESGVVRDDPARGFLHTMCDLPNLVGALRTTGMLDIMARLQRGDIDVGFLGGAEVDRWGNLNTTLVGAGEPGVRLPGSGGASDIACLSHRTVLLMAHEPRRFVERVRYVTSPGHGRADATREDLGLPPGGPAALITSRAVLGFEDREMVLRSVHPGEDVADVKATFPWDLPDAGAVEDAGIPTTDPPTPRELALVRGFDPEGFWSG